MSVVEPGSPGGRLVDRVRDILLRPTATWEVIDVETTTVSDLYRSYVVPLAAIWPVCGLIGMTVIGFGFPPFGPRFGLVSTALSMLVFYALSLGMVFVIGLVIEGLAPAFSGVRRRAQAMKVAVYASTAFWVAGVFMLVPMLSWLGIVGLYSFYLLYKGLPRLMRVSDDKAVPFLAVIMLISILLYIVVFAIASPMTRGERSVITRSGAAEPKAAEQVGAAAGGGARPATDPSAYQRLLPAAVAGMTRTELATGRGGIMGMEGSAATARYERAGAKIELAVTDLGGAGALTGLLGSLDVESSSERNGSYERVGKVDGRLTFEEYDSRAKHGAYGFMVGEQFLVLAEGDGVTMDELKAAVAQVDVGELEELAEERE